MYRFLTFSLDSFWNTVTCKNIFSFVQNSREALYVRTCVFMYVCSHIYQPSLFSGCWGRGQRGEASPASLRHFSNSHANWESSPRTQVIQRSIIMLYSLVYINFQLYNKYLLNMWRYRPFPGYQSVALVTGFQFVISEKINHNVSIFSSIFCFVTLEFLSSQYWTLSLQENQYQTSIKCCQILDNCLSFKNIQEMNEPRRRSFS